MLKQLIIILLAIGITGVSAQKFSSREPFLTKTLTNERFDLVKVQTSGGNISVTGTDGQYRVEMYVWPSNNQDRDLSKTDIQQRLDDYYDIDISVSNNKLNVVAKSKKNNSEWKKGLNISFKVFAPHKVSTDLRTSGGNVSLSELSGPTQDFTTSGGNMDIDHLSGNLHGRTSGGNISLSNSSDDIDLTTSGGNVDATKCHGKISLSTSGGNVTLGSLEGTVKAITSGGSVRGESVKGELTARTSGGDVRLENMYCSLDASTSGGNIDVSVKELGKFLKISNSSGNIDVEIPGDKGMDLKLYADRIKTSTLNNFNGKVEEKHISGTLNGGGVPVTVDAGSGNLHLTLK